MLFFRFCLHSLNKQYKLILFIGSLKQSVLQRHRRVLPNVFRLWIVLRNSTQLHCLRQWVISLTQFMSVTKRHLHHHHYHHHCGSFVRWTCYKLILNWIGFLNILFLICVRHSNIQINVVNLQLPNNLYEQSKRYK